MGVERAHGIAIEPSSGSEDLCGRALDGRYRIVRKLGAGGMGAVYEAEHVALGAKVAIKVLSSNLAARGKYRQRFLREARAVSAIRSEHVVQISDFGSTSDGVVYFAMEYLEGEDLEARLKREGPMSWVRARGLFLQILCALRAAHDKKIIHRDIKPSNCFLFDEPERRLSDRIKVLDFGLAKVDVEEDPCAQPLTATDELFGTTAYMAPELSIGKPADVRSDLYAVGILMYRTLVGTLPFRASTAYLLLDLHIHEPAPSARRAVPELPEPVDAIILRALAKDPDQRFQSAQQMLRALEEVPVVVLGKRRRRTLRASSPSPTSCDAITSPSSRASEGGGPPMQPPVSVSPVVTLRPVPRAPARVTVRRSRTLPASAMPIPPAPAPVAVPAMPIPSSSTPGSRLASRVALGLGLVGAVGMAAWIGVSHAVPEGRGEMSPPGGEVVRALARSPAPVLAGAPSAASPLASGTSVDQGSIVAAEPGDDDEVTILPPEPEERASEPARSVKPTKAAASVPVRPSMSTLKARLIRHARSKCQASGTFRVQARHEAGVPKPGGVLVKGDAPRSVLKCIGDLVEEQSFPAPRGAFIAFVLRV